MIIITLLVTAFLITFCASFCLTVIHGQQASKVREEAYRASMDY